MNIRIFRNCRVVLRGLFFFNFIGPSLGVFNLLVLCTGILAHDFSGRFVGISDGDTIGVIHDGRTEKIRLYGIDAPENGEAFVIRAKQFVSTQANGKSVWQFVK